MHYEAVGGLGDPIRPGRFCPPEAISKPIVNQTDSILGLRFTGVGGG